MARSPSRRIRQPCRRARWSCGTTSTASLTASCWITDHWIRGNLAAGASSQPMSINGTSNPYHCSIHPVHGRHHRCRHVYHSGAGLLSRSIASTMQPRARRTDALAEHRGKVTVFIRWKAGSRSLHRRDGLRARDAHDDNDRQRCERDASQLTDTAARSRKRQTDNCTQDACIDCSLCRRSQRAEMKLRTCYGSRTSAAAK